MSSPTAVDAVVAEALAEPDRRRHARHPGRGMAELIRESDPLRHVLRVELLDVSMSGAGLLTSALLKNDERIRLRLRNVVQRFLKEVRGIVRWSIPTGDGRYRVGIELATPFSAIDMQMLKRAGIGTTGAASSIWV